MGLDLSLTATGLVVRAGDRVRRWRLLETEPATKEGQSLGLLPSGKYRGSTEARVEWSASQVRKAWRKFRPDIVVIEEYAFGARGRGLSSLHEHGGVVKNFLYRMQAPFVTVTGSEIKFYATGSGGASKEDMIQQALEYWPGFPNIKKNDNVADAFWLAHWGQANYSALVFAGNA